MNKKLLFKTFRNTIIATIYIILVSQLLQSRVFVKAGDILGPIAILMLFCSSAAIVGGLVFGEAIIQLINNKKQECVRASLYSVGWLGVYTIIILLITLMVSID